MTQAQEAINAFAQANEAFQGALNAQKPDIEKLIQASEVWAEHRSRLLADIARVESQASVFGIHAKSNDRLITLTRSAQRPGLWQTTRFDAEGKPWGDSQYLSLQSALDEFLRECRIERSYVEQTTMPLRRDPPHWEFSTPVGACCLPVFSLQEKNQ